MTATRSRPPTTGPHECKACGALPYSEHEADCRKVSDS